MVLPLSRRAKVLLGQSNIKGQIILEIDGFDDQAIFGAVDIEKFARIGEDELTIGEFYIGGTIKDKLSRAYISMTGTTTKVSQQIIPDQGGTGSIQKIDIRLIDKNGELSRIFRPGEIVPDLHGVKARVYAAFQGGAHPEDSIRVLSGIIKKTRFGAGYVQLSIAHPEELKRADLFPRIEGELDSAVDISQLTIPLLSAAGLLIPEDILDTYVIIDDEIVKYTGISVNTLTGCTRGALGTIAAPHDDEAEVSSFYTIQESTIPLALKLMFSGPRQFFAENLSVSDFVRLSPSATVNNAVVFKHPDIQDRYGLSVGDKLTTSGAANGANNVSGKAILSFGTFDGGSYVVLDGVSLVEEVDTSALVSFESQYRTMTQDGTGVNLSPEQVDVERFLFWEDLFGTTYPYYLFELTESVNAKDFLDKEVLHPSALYSVPRKGRISLHFSIPPLALEDVVKINISNVLNPEKLEVDRSVNQFFYNTIQYDYNYDAIDSKFRRSDRRVSVDSLERIKVGVKKLVIESRGLRQDIDAQIVIDSLSRRLLDRYRFGTEIIRGVQVNYKTGMPLEVSDAVVLEGESLKLVDTSRGDRFFEPRLFEIINKSWDYGKGMVSLDLLDTGFEINARYGVMGPSSYIGLGSTTTNIVIKKSFATGPNDVEVEKWRPYIGEIIKIRGDEYTSVEEVHLLEIPENRNDVLTVEALSSPPSENMIVDMPDYSGDTSVKALWKNIHCFVCPVVDVVSGISGTQFTVAAGDISKFFVGGYCRVHNSDFSRDSERKEITDVTGTTITVAENLGFTPQANDEARPIGFSDDNGLPYNYL